MTLFISSFILAIAFCAPPGVVTAETIRRGFARGFWPALSVQIGSLIGDAFWATLAIAGAAVLIQNWILRLMLSFAGIGFLAHLAYKAIREARKETALDPAPVSNGGDLATGMLLSLSNPFAIVFWVSVGASVFAGVPGTPRIFHYLTFYCAFFLGLVLWCFLMAGMVAWGRKFINPMFFRWVNLACGLTLGGFALQLGWRLVQSM